MNGGIAYPLALTALIAVTHFRLPGWLVLGLPFLSDVMITLEVEITPIWKPVSSKLKISSSVTPYLAIVSLTSLNHKLISLANKLRVVYFCSLDIELSIVNA